MLQSKHFGLRQLSSHRRVRIVDPKGSFTLTAVEATERMNYIGAYRMSLPLPQLSM